MCICGFSRNSNQIGSRRRTICHLTFHADFLTCLLKQSLRQTPLYDFHIKHGAKLVPFAGYHMPLVYGDVGQRYVPFNDYPNLVL